MEKLRDCLRNLSPEILIENELILRAKKSLNTMLKLS
jgi:quinolinate synthase